MLWHRDERLPPSASTRSPVVPGSDALRQAALEASWRRDRQVAQRRIAWRWVVWCVQRYSLPTAGVLGATALVVYLAGVWPQGPDAQPQPVVASPDRAPPDTAPVLPAPPLSTALPVEALNDQAPLSLRVSTGLNEAPAAPAAETGAPASADTLSLKPETWLHSKEP